MQSQQFKEAEIILQNMSIEQLRELSPEEIQQKALEFSSKPDPKKSEKKLQLCESLCDELAETNINQPAVHSERPKPTPGIKTLNEAKEALKNCLDTAKSLSESSKAAKADRDLKKQLAIKADSELRTAEVHYGKIRAPSQLDTGNINAIRTQAKGLEDDFNRANQLVNPTENDYQFSLIRLKAARKNLAMIQSTEILREAMDNSVLLDAVRQCAILLRCGNVEPDFQGIKTDLTRVFVTALFDTTPSYNEAIKAIDELAFKN